MAPQETCMGCHWVHIGPSPTNSDEMVIECRRYPPVPIVVEGEPVQAFPGVDAEMWCGEWTRPT